MRTLVLALALAAVPLLVAAPAHAEPLPDLWDCIPESPCCDTLVCEPEPCRVGMYYIC